MDLETDKLSEQIFKDYLTQEVKFYSYIILYNDK